MALLSNGFSWQLHLLASKEAPFAHIRRLRRYSSRPARGPRRIASRAQANIGSEAQIEGKSMGPLGAGSSHTKSKRHRFFCLSAINPPLNWSSVIRRGRKSPKGNVARYHSMSNPPTPHPPFWKSRCSAMRLVNGPRLHLSIFYPDRLDNCQGSFPSHCD